MEINNEGMPYPILWGNKVSYVPFSAITFILLMFGAQLSGLYISLNLGGLWNLFLAFFTDAFEGMTFVEISLKMFSDWISGWAF